MAELININQLDPNTFEFQEYSLEDTSLITSNQIETTFDPESDYIEYFVYDLNNNILFSNEIGYPNYTLEDNQLSLEPVSNLQSVGFTEGNYNTLYNIFSPKLGSSALNRYLARYLCMLEYLKPTILINQNGSFEAVRRMGLN